MKRARAFSLTELLVVIAVIGILASLLLTITGQVWTSAQTVACQHRLEQIGKACQLYATQHKGYEVRAASPGGSENSRWYVAVLPYLSGATEPGLATLRCPMADEREGELVYNPPEPGPDDPEPLPQHLSEDILVIIYGFDGSVNTSYDRWLLDLETGVCRDSTWKGWKEANGNAPERPITYDATCHDYWRQGKDHILGYEDYPPPNGTITEVLPGESWKRVTYNTPWPSSDVRSVMWQPAGRPGYHRLFFQLTDGWYPTSFFYDFEGDTEMPHKGWHNWTTYSPGWRILHSRGDKDRLTSVALEKSYMRTRPWAETKDTVTYGGTGGVNPTVFNTGFIFANSQYETKWQNEIVPLFTNKVFGASGDPPDNVGDINGPANNHLYPPRVSQLAAARIAAGQPHAEARLAAGAEWAWPHAIHVRQRQSYVPTPEDLANYGQVWPVVYWQFREYDSQGNKVFADDIVAFKRFREEAGGGLFLVLSGTQEMWGGVDNLNPLLTGLGLGLKLQRRPEHPQGIDSRCRMRNDDSRLLVIPEPYRPDYWTKDEPPWMNNMAAFPEMTFLASQYSGTLLANLEGAYDVWLPNWVHYYNGCCTWGRFTPGHLYSSPHEFWPERQWYRMPVDFATNYYGQPRSPRAYTSWAYEIVPDTANPNPLARELIKENGYGRTIAACVDYAPPMGGRVVVIGNGHAYSNGYQRGYAISYPGEYGGYQFANFGRLLHEGLQFSRNVADWLKGGVGSPPAPRKKLWEYVGQCHFGYNDRVAVDPETRTQHVKLTATNPGETIRALDYAYFVAAQEGGIGEIAARHGGKANVLFMDGHVELLAPEEVMNPDRNYWDVGK